MSEMFVDDLRDICVYTPNEVFSLDIMVIMETIVLFWLTGYYDRYSTSSDQRPSRTHRDSDDTLLGQRTQPEAINEWGQKHYESSNEGIVPLHGTTNYHFISVCVYSKEMNYSICFLRNSVKFRFFSGFIFLCIFIVFLYFFLF